MVFSALVSLSLDDVPLIWAALEELSVVSVVSSILLSLTSPLAISFILSITLVFITSNLNEYFNKIGAIF